MFQILPVTESGHIRHLDIRHAEELVPVLVLQLHDVEDALHALSEAGVDQILAEVRQLLQIAVLAPHGLSHHLGQLHGGYGGTEPTVAAENIHTGLEDIYDKMVEVRNLKSSHLDQSDGLAQDQLGVLLQLCTQLDPAQMRLKRENIRKY